MSDIDEDTLSDVLSWGAIGFGAAATVTPRLFEKLYGLEDEGELRVMTRLWGSRTTVLGLVLMAAEKDERRRLSMLMAGMNVVDALVIATAGPDVRRSSRVMGALTAAAFAAGHGLLLSDS